MARTAVNSPRTAPIPVASGREPARALSKSEWRTSLAAAALVAAALLAVYARVLTAPFVFDDNISIIRNDSIRQVWPLWGDDEHRGPFNPVKQLPTTGRPLVNLSFALNYHWGELNPLGYRAVNLVIHFFSALMLMLIVRRTMRLPSFGGQFDRAAGPLALAVALLWAVHPLNTESVAYVTQRTELLVGLAYLATLYAAIRYWTVATRSVRSTWLTLAVTACAAGMASKEMMVAAPVVVLLFDWTFVGRSLGRIARESWPLYSGLGATWALLLALNVGGPRSASAGFNLSVSALEWWFTQAQVVWMYLRLAVWPWPLVLHYELPYLTTWTQAAPWVAATGALAAASIWLLWRQRAAGFVGSTFFAVLGPTLIVPIASEVAAERRMYVPLAALVALGVVGSYALLRKLTPAAMAHGASAPTWPLKEVTAAALLLAVLAGVVSARRLAAYQTETAIWEDAVIRQPDNFVANFNLSSCLYQSGRVEESVLALERAVQKRPGNVKARIVLGTVLAECNRTWEAIAQFREALRLKPDEFTIYPRLAEAYVQVRRPDEAIEVAEQAAELARTSGQTEALNQIEAWLTKYRAVHSQPPAVEQPKPSATAPATKAGGDDPSDLSSQ